MNLTLGSNDPFNGTLSDSTNGTVVYQMNTHNLVRRVTLLTKFVPDLGQFEPVADFHWEELSFTSSYIVYRGRKILMSDFMRRKTVISRSREFIAADDKKYKWKINLSENLILYDESENIVARTHKQHYGIFHKERNYSIEIFEPGIPILDDIIVSFLIMYQLQKVERDTVNAVAAAS